MKSWHTLGWAHLSNFLDVTEQRQEMARLYPIGDANAVHEFGSGGRGDFPCDSDALNRMAVHPKLIAAVSALLGTRDIELTQSVAWAKYGRDAPNRDQRMHMDYGNNYWTHPPPFDRPDMVAAIVYYSDTGVTGGATAVVPRQGDNDPVYQWPYVHMPGIAGRPFVNNREAAERMLPAEDTALRAQCYAREVMPHFRPGDVLLYRMDVWHRGTPVHPGHVRYAHNLAWKRRDARGICHWNAGWTQKMYGGWLETFVCSLNETQRSTLGFPRLAALAPEVREATRARYLSRL